MAGIGVGERVGSPIHIGVEPGLDVAGKCIAGSTLEDMCKLAERDTELRRPDDLHFSVDDIKVMLGRLQDMACKLLRLLSDRALPAAPMTQPSPFAGWQRRPAQAARRRCHREQR